MKAITTNWPVLFRAFLYWMIAFLTPFSEQIIESLKSDTWPSPQRAVLGMLVGMAAGFTALRAYYDGSAERHKNDTQMFVQPK